MHLPTRHHIINGDSRQMAELADNSVELVVTSPPYWQLKDYGAAGQIGYGDSYEDYINHLNLVWRECFRVLNGGCRLCVNIGDQFARAVYYGRYKVIPIRTEIIKFCEAIGFDYMGAIIWQKKITTNTTGGASLMGSYPLPRNGILSIDYEFILLFKKLGTTPKPDSDRCKMSALSKDEWKTYFSGHWNFAGVKQNGHIAMFPAELPTRLIKMFSFVGDTVLDPFVGSGTTMLAAKNLMRHSAGYEINSDFIPLIRKKLNVNADDLSGTQHQLTKQKKRTIDYRQAINALPYQFLDFHRLDRKIDPKKLQFGSRIDRSAPMRREEYYSVKEIISPTIIRLNNDSLIRLIGVSENAKTLQNAVDFLRLKTKGQKVFMRFDAIKHDENSRLMAYLYLANKTFLNAHLIKSGLASVDLTRDYKNKARFIKYSKVKG